MKKLTLTIAIVLGMTVGAMAQNGGLFERGYVSDEVYYGVNENNDSYFFSLLRGTNPDINLPDHGENTDQNATPLGGGIALLLGMGAAYAVAKKRKE